MINILPHNEHLTVATDLGDCLFRMDTVTPGEHDLIEYMLINDFKEARRAGVEARVLRRNESVVAVRLQTTQRAAVLVYVEYRVSFGI